MIEPKPKIGERENMFNKSNPSFLPNQKGSTNETTRPTEKQDTEERGQQSKEPVMIMKGSEQPQSAESDDELDEDEEEEESSDDASLSSESEKGIKRKTTGEKGLLKPSVTKGSYQ